jgi:hypothetical protein
LIILVPIFLLIAQNLPDGAALVVVLALTTFVPAITLVLPDLLLN